MTTITSNTFVFLATCLLISGYANAIDYIFDESKLETCAQGCFFNDATIWIPQGVPGKNDSAQISNANSNNATLLKILVAENLILRTLQLNNATFQLLPQNSSVSGPILELNALYSNNSVISINGKLIITTEAKISYGTRVVVMGNGTALLVSGTMRVTDKESAMALPSALAVIGMGNYTNFKLSTDVFACVECVFLDTVDMGQFSGVITCTNCLFKSGVNAMQTKNVSFVNLSFGDGSNSTMRLTGNITSMTLSPNSSLVTRGASVAQKVVMMENSRLVGHLVTEYGPTEFVKVLNLVVPVPTNVYMAGCIINNVNAAQGR